MLQCFLFLLLTIMALFLSLREDGSGSAYDKESMAIIKLNNTTVLYLKEVTKFLALVCILREESFERKGKTVRRRHGPRCSFGLIWLMATWPFPDSTKTRTPVWTDC